MAGLCSFFQKISLEIILISTLAQQSIFNPGNLQLIAKAGSSPLSLPVHEVILSAVPLIKPSYALPTHRQLLDFADLSQQKMLVSLYSLCRSR